MVFVGGFHTKKKRRSMFKYDGIIFIKIRIDLPTLSIHAHQLEILFSASFDS